MLEEKLQPAPAVCASLSETMARGEGGWHSGLPQPLWEALEIPQLVLRLERGNDFYESRFLTKKRVGKKKTNNHPARLHINQGNKTACGCNQIIRSKSI